MNACKETRRIDSLSAADLQAACAARDKLLPEATRRAEFRPSVRLSLLSALPEPGAETRRIGCIKNQKINK